MWFRSKIDWWLAVLLMVAPVASLVGAVTAPPNQQLVAFAGVVVLAAVYLGMVFPMRYGIMERELIVRFGLLRRRILLADIRSVEPTRNPLSSPALSLDRLSIKFGDGYFKRILISPAEKEKFLVELALKARLVRNGDGLVRL